MQETAFALGKVNHRSLHLLLMLGSLYPAVKRIEQLPKPVVSICCHCWGEQLILPFSHSILMKWEMKCTVILFCQKCYGNERNKKIINSSNSGCMKQQSVNNSFCPLKINTGWDMFLCCMHYASCWNQDDAFDHVNLSYANVVLQVPYFIVSYLTLI